MQNKTNDAPAAEIMLMSRETTIVTTTTAESLLNLGYKSVVQMILVTEKTVLRSNDGLHMKHSSRAFDGRRRESGLQ